MAEDSLATFESLFRAHWPDADSKDAARHADEATAAVLRLVQSRSFFAQLIAASIVLHLAALAALVWMEHAPPLKPNLAQEIPVDLVTAPPPDAKPSGGPQGASKPGAPKPAAAAAPKPEAKPEAPKPPPPAPKPEALKPPPPKPEPQAGLQARACQARACQARAACRGAQGAGAKA